MPSVVKLASGNYAVDLEGRAAIGQLKSVVNLKTSGGKAGSLHMRVRLLEFILQRS